MFYFMSVHIEVILDKRERERERTHDKIILYYTKIKI